MRSPSEQDRTSYGGNSVLNQEPRVIANARDMDRIADLLDDARLAEDQTVDLIYTLQNKLKDWFGSKRDEKLFEALYQIGHRLDCISEVLVQERKKLYKQANESPLDLVETKDGGH